MADILAIPPLERGLPEVLSGHESLDEPVRWVHVSDLVAVARLLDAGDLLLTTGGFLHLPAREAVSELDAVVARGAVGVIIELGTVPGTVSPAVLARAAERGFPVVALHGKVRFVEVTEHVHRELVSEQLAEARFAAEVHAAFTALALDRADRARVLDAAGDLLGAAVVLEDQRRRVLGTTSPGGTSATTLADWERRSRLAPWEAGTAVVGPGAWVTTTVGSEGRMWARLVAPAPGSTARASVVLERAAQALELGRMIERDDAAAELRLHGSLLADLLAGRLAEEGEALARLRAVGMPRAGSYVALVASQPPGTAVVEEAELLRRLIRGTRAEALVALLDDEHVGALLLGPPPPALGRAYAEEGAGALAAGHAVTRLVDLPGSLRSARTVADVSLSLPVGARPDLATHADIRLHGLVSALGDSPALAPFAEAELGRVLDHDARHGTDLLDLLRAYLDAGGNVTELARATHRNRSSLYPSLTRLEGVLGHPLGTVRSRTSLSVALLIHDLGRDAGSPR